MAKKASSADPSLPLHEVLESEFVALHGELPADYPNSTESERRLKAFCAAVHGLKEKRSALCISGGGIRSATFGLGILQGLARCGLLNKFHYLSTVSGGGYIGSWLSAWIKNHPQGVEGVVAELKRRPDLTLDPEPRPIRHLREFSNYLSPRLGLTSADSWTLIATFIRNMFLNWLVLISLLAACMMIPRLYLAAINLQPDWSGLATLHSWHLLANNLPPDWNAWEDSVKRPWDIGLTILLAVGFALIAFAMAYAFIDVPSAGNARLSQRRFLIYRQLPLFLASLILAAWWAVFFNVHGGEPFRAADWWLKFVVLFVLTYVCGGLIGKVVLSFLKREQKPGGVWRLIAIVVTAGFAGFCLWAMATGMFLDPKEIEFTRGCEAVQIPSEQTITISSGSTGVIKQIVWGSDTIGTRGTNQVVFRTPPWLNLGLGDITLGTDQAVARIAEKDLDALELNPVPGPEINLKFTFTRDCEAIQIPSGRKTKIREGTEGEIMETVERSYTVKTDQGLEARIATKDLDLLKLRQPKFTLVRNCEATEISTGRKTKILKGAKGKIKSTDEGSYTVEADPVLARITAKDLGTLELNGTDPRTNLQKFTSVRNCEATEVSSGRKTKILKGAKGLVIETDGGSYTVETDPVQARIAKKDLDAFDLNPVPAPAKDALNYVCFAPALIMAVVMLVNFLFTGLTSKVTKDEDREWWGRSAAWILVTIASWIVVNLVVLWGAQAISPEKGNQLVVFLGHVKANPIANTILGAFGGITGIVGALLALRSKLSKRLGRQIGSQWPLIIAAVVFFVLLAVIISWILLLIGSQRWLQNPNDWRGQLFVVFILTGAMAVVGIVMGFFINANQFSLHATYRNRLIRAYLAASLVPEVRKPSLFTGFDPADNFALRELPPEKPLHVINGTLNLVKGEQLAWQERKAESFTMSRLHCGCLHVGYRSSAEYGDAITLGTAMAISGAAANPNMGYHSSPIVGFLMTLFNVRLGWWLGNPGSRGAKTWRRSGPWYSVGPLFSEALGRTTDRSKYVNLSDGGHFENLGLYEMVLRRCHFIVVSDAGEDPECTFADLGEAVRKIRVDFGIPIEFDEIKIFPRSDDFMRNRNGRRCAIGRICYSAVDGATVPDGVLIYIKPACYGDEPRDIYEYFKTNKTFPHESTTDQFFSESQFESYRMLGAYTMEKLCAQCAGDFRCFIRDILKRHLKMKAPDWLAELLGTKREWLTRLKFSCRKLQK